MSESMLLGVAVSVFLLLLIGLGLTVIEFRYGQPRREGERTTPTKSTVEERRTAKAA